MAPNLDKAFALIDAAHAQDPNKVEIDGEQVPYESHYAELMTSYLHKHSPDASAIVATACRAQHFRRWEVPRSSYPDGKAGYFKWRTFLKERQAQQVREICLQSGFSEHEASQVARLIAKNDLRRGGDTGDADAQIVEDVACLVFLHDQFDDFEKSHDEDKIVAILRKTWAKMGRRGHELALSLELSDRAKELVTKALSG
ncbi:hypothetical protein DV735_g1675, partial [Chaetothyriales sp. CBS 134920]